MLRVGVVAGEASGDVLGARLLEELKEKYGEVSVTGIGGPLMQKQGCVSLFPMERLSVMGILEVVSRLPELLKIRSELSKHLLAEPPDLFIGIDAPDFNLGLEKSLRQNGIPVVHYVSPSVWAWRKYRIRKIARSVDLMLNLFPFELDIYRQNNIQARFVGHPLAEQVGMTPNRHAARERLGIDHDGLLIALMPGSREREIKQLLPKFLEAAAIIREKEQAAQFISSVLNETAASQCRHIHEQLNYSVALELYINRSHDVLEAADIVLLASGTITLEAMLFKKPMVVAYELNPLSYLVVKLLAHVEHASLPNLLAGEELVPECLQQDCRSELMADHILELWRDREQRERLEQKFAMIHQSLLPGSKDSAAGAISNFIDSRLAAGS